MNRNMPSSPKPRLHNLRFLKRLGKVKLPSNRINMSLLAKLRKSGPNPSNVHLNHRMKVFEATADQI